jgi:hypothetical protein
LYDKNLKLAPLELASLARQKLPNGLGSNSLKKRMWDNDEDIKKEVVTARRVILTVAVMVMVARAD